MLKENKASDNREFNVMSYYTDIDMEQGELSASPDLDDSPGVRLDEEEEEEEHEEVEQDDDRTPSREEDDDTLDIKPPQTHVGRSKDKRKHSKHKDERRRERESGRDRNEERSRNRSRDRTKDHYKEESSSKEPREKEKSRGSQKPPKDREVEDKRRAKSLRERERLERLERERYRLEREAADRLRAAEREKQRERAERHRRKEEVAPHDARRRLQEEPRRERSRDKHGSREKSRSPISKHSSRDKKEERSRRHEEDDRRKYRREHVPPSPERKEVIERSPEPEIPPPHKREEEDIHSPSANEEHSEQSSGSESERSRSERSERERSEREHSEEGRSDVEPEAPRRNSSGKFRSKFDDERSIEEDSDKDSVIISDNDVNMDDDTYLDQTPPQSPMELKPELPPYYPALQGCRNVEEFHCLNKIEEGTYGVVFRARDKKADEIVALKKLKMEKEKEGFPITSLREINTLLKAQHVNIVTVREIVVGSNIDKIYIVMDYVEHDLKSLMETMREPFMIGEVKTLMIQLIRGVNHLHDNWIIHRDLKTSNLLLSHKGILKIGDFGLAREYGSPLKQYTPIVVTLWYRAPELLLGCKEYSTAIDMWSVGCIFAEFLTRKPLFPGKSELDELNRIFKDLGTPNERIWPGVSELPGMKKCTFAEHPYNQLRNRFGSSLADKGFDLMNRFLTYDPVRRISASEGVKHEYFKQEPLPVPPSMFPTWPAKSEMPRRTHGNSPKPPSGGKAYAKLLGDDDIGFHLTGATKGAAAVGYGFSLKF